MEHKGLRPLINPGVFRQSQGREQSRPFYVKKSSEEFGERQSEKRTQHSRVKKQNAAPSRALSGTVALKLPPGLSPPANRVFNGKAFALSGPRAFGPLRGAVFPYAGRGNRRKRGMLSDKAPCPRGKRQPEGACRDGPQRPLKRGGRKTGRNLQISIAFLGERRI